MALTKPTNIDRYLIDLAPDFSVIPLVESLYFQKNKESDLFFIKTIESSNKNETTTTKQADEFSIETNFYRGIFFCNNSLEIKNPKKDFVSSNEIEWRDGKVIIVVSDNCITLEAPKQTTSYIVGVAF